MIYFLIHYLVPKRRFVAATYYKPYVPKLLQVFKQLSATRLVSPGVFTILGTRRHIQTFRTTVNVFVMLTLLRGISSRQMKRPCLYSYVVVFGIVLGLRRPSFQNCCAITGCSVSNSLEQPVTVL